MENKDRNRKIELNSIQNARELGGMVTEDGRTIRSGMLLRSANLINAADDDLEHLKTDHNLTKVIDLRTAEEIQRKPDKRSDDIEYCPMPVLTDRLIGITHEDDPVTSSGNERIPVMEKIYRVIAVNEECRGRLSSVITAIVEHDYSDGSVLWHCTEGKDRCGIVTALVLTMLGVSREDIMDDYLLTNDVNGPKAENIYKYIMADRNDPEFAEAIKKAFLADRKYMEAAFEAMEEKSGSLYSYVTDWLGIPEEKIEIFREQILE